MAEVFYYITCCVVILNWVEFAYCQKFVGDTCKVPKTGASGQCEIITKCPSALQDLKLGVNPRICGFQGTQSIVCCVGTTSRTEPTPAAVTTVNKLPVGDKSRAKCKEYEKYVYQRVIANAPPTAACGITQVPLIIGGTAAKSKEFPHMALIGFDGENKEKKWQCGGSLISDQFVLTAGHCLYAQQLGEAKYIRIGDLVLNSETDDAEPQDFNVLQIFRHPDYRPPSRYNDIALLKMNKKAQLNPYVRPACLYTNPTLNVTWKPLASGWGQVGWSGDTSQDLLKVTLEYFSNADCNKSYKSEVGMRLSNGIVDVKQICAGSRNESKDTCQGDSGGPLQVISDEEFCMYKIVGVTSFGKGCGAVSIPAVYTRVSSYIKWIEEIVWP